MNARPDAPRPRSRGRRVSRRRYLVRRLGVAAVLILGLFGLVKVAGAALDGGDPGAEADTSTTSPPADGPAGVAAAATVPETTAAAASTSAAPSTSEAPSTSAAPAETGPPSADNPARLLVVGDSDAGTFGPYLESLMDDTGVVDTEVDYKVSSGLSRPDFFDWQSHVSTKIEETDPDIVVVTFGGNDAQGMATVEGEFPNEWADPVGGRYTWFSEYRRRAGEFVDRLGDRTVIWVGIPNDNNPEVTARLAVQDESVRAALRTRRHVIFVDTWRRFSGRDGNWAEYVIDPRDGRGKPVRAGDGFHLNENGAEILALDIANVIRAELEARGADL